MEYRLGVLISIAIQVFYKMEGGKRKRRPVSFGGMDGSDEGSDGEPEPSSGSDFSEGGKKGEASFSSEQK